LNSAPTPIQIHIVPTVRLVEDLPGSAGSGEDLDIDESTPSDENRGRGEGEW
jgi:hypothetical protein